MRAVLRWITCDNIPDDLAQYQPPNPHDVNIQLCLGVGSDDFDGVDNFYLTVCTPRWLESRITEPVEGRGYLLVSRYDHQKMMSFITSYIARCTGNSWEEVAGKLGRLAPWEFEANLSER